MRYWAPPKARREQETGGAAYATQAAYRRVSAFLDKLVAAWGRCEVPWLDVREGVVAVAELAESEHGVPVRASMLPLPSGAYRVIVQVGREGGALLSAVRRFEKLTDEPQRSESRRTAERFSVLGAWHNCAPEVEA